MFDAANSVSPNNQLLNPQIEAQSENLYSSNWYQTMDLLCDAYSNATDEDEEKERSVEPPLKRAKPEFPPRVARSLPVIGLKQASNVTVDAPIAGRYISKRERALMASGPQTPEPDPPTSVPSCTVPGSISDACIRKDIMSSLRNPAKRSAYSGAVSERISTTLNGHTKSVNALQWSKTNCFGSLMWNLG